MRTLPRWSAVLLFLSALPAISATAQDLGSGIAFVRAQHLQHGINTGIWFAQARDYSPQRLRTFTTPDDITLIARMGFNHNVGVKLIVLHRPEKLPQLWLSTYTGQLLGRRQHLFRRGRR